MNLTKLIPSKPLRATLLLVMILMTALCTSGQRKMETLGRGTMAVRKSANEVFIHWRITAPEYQAGAVYNLYRGMTRIATNLEVSNFTDTISTNNAYSVATVIDGVEQKRSPAVTVVSTTHSDNTLPSLRIPIVRTSGYYVGLAWVGDLDGDGEYDFVLVKHPDDASKHILVEAYLRNGTRLWQYDCGPNSVNKDNISPGSSALGCGHGDNLTVYDLNNDGRAEVIIRTANGSVFGDGQVLTNSNNNRQFISVLDGMTGKENARADVPTDVLQYGPMNGHMGIAYLDGINPSVVWSSKNRRPNKYFDMMVSAYTMDGNSLKLTWKYIRPEQGGGPDGHNIRMVDVDNDGRDEIIPWGYCLNPDGKLRWNLGSQGVVHGDRFYVGKMDPDRPGQQGYMIMQDQPQGMAWCYYDTKDGKILKSQYRMPPADYARGVAGDFDPRFPGYEFHTFTDGMYNVSGDKTSSSLPGSYPNIRIWWDGDLGSENLDNRKMVKWNYLANVEERLYTFTGIRQWARNVPSFSGDIMGDWREEVVYPSDDGNSLLVFSTLYPTTERIYTLPHNPKYRADMTVKGYVQGYMVDFYLGFGMAAPSAPKIDYNCYPTPIVPRLQVNNEQAVETSMVTVNEGSNISFTPLPLSGGSWRWEGPSEATSQNRLFSVNNIQKNQAGTYTALFTNDLGCLSTHQFNVVVQGGTSSKTPDLDTDQLITVENNILRIDNNNQEATIGIFDLKGSILYRKKIFGNTALPLDSFVGKGACIVVVNINNNQVFRKTIAF